MSNLPIWFDDTFIITLVGMCGGCFGYVLTFLLKSRCRTIDCCGIKCDRDVVPAAELRNIEIASATSTNTPRPSIS